MRRATRRATWGLAALGVLAALRAAPARGDDPPPESDPDAAPAAPEAPSPVEAPQNLVEQINHAQAAGLSWLKKRQGGDGSWGNLHVDGPSYSGERDGYDQPTGPTSLAVYTLLKAGVPASDDAVRKGFAYLRKSQAHIDAYEVSMLLLAVTATADPFKRSADSKAAGDRVKLVGDLRKWALDLTARLVAMRNPAGWRYWGKGDEHAGGTQDLSSTQLAALALFAAARCGIVVDPAVWSGIAKFTREQQEPEGPEHPRAVVAPKAGAKPAAPAEGYAPPAGAEPDSPADRARGFAYMRGSTREADERRASGAMTACGVGNLMMSRFQLATRSPKAWALEDAAGLQAAVYDGLAWLDLHWDPISNPGGGVAGYHVYYLYCVERAMDLVGARRLGKHLWYVDMTEQLLPLQKKAGFWDSQSTLANGPVLDTCFALLFLHRATLGGIPFPSVTGGSEDLPVDDR